MGKYDHHSKESIISVLEEMDREIKQYRKQAKKGRKKRSDVGQKRPAYFKNLPPKYRGYLARANQRGFAFDFTVDEFDTICASECAYCGSVGNNGIDRIDSSVGYTKENSQPCCTRCNWMKRTDSHEVFIDHIRRIYRHSQRNTSL